MTSRSSIELVDRLDRKYQKVGKDLILTVEDRDGIVRTDTPDDYVGLEMDLRVIDENRKRKRRNQLFLVVLLALVIIIGGSLYYKKSTTSASPSPSPPKNTPVHNPPHAPPSSKAPVITLPPNGDTQSTPSPQDASSITLWPTHAPLPPFDICPPPLKQHSLSAIYKLSKLVIVPEAPTTDDNDDLDNWEYSFSDMDISEEASIIAVGLEDFSRTNNNNSTIWSVGMVRVFGWSCGDNEWKQLGQDLLGQNQWEQFGHKVRSSKDGKIMAVSAPQQDFEGGIGFVQVYALNEDSNSWETLGGRIENLNDTSSEYYNLGHAIDLSDRGETLAVLAIVNDNEFVTRVFDYDYNTQEWMRKGHDLKLTIDYPDDLDFVPQLSLSEAGDELSVADPQLGVVTYRFHFQQDKWLKSDTKKLTWDEEDTWWMESMDMDNAATLVGFSAFVVDGASTVKLVDYKNDTSVEVYNNTYKDEAVSIHVSISDNGQVAAIVASKEDEDDTMFWLGDYVGTMTIVSKDDDDGLWKVIGNGTHASNLGVPGDFVTLSGDGQIAAVGSDTVVQLYGIALNHKVEEASNNNNKTNTTSGTDNEEENPSFSVCAPFPDATANDHVGDLDQLPKQQEEHTLSIATNEDGSVVAVGIDLYESEDRGLARVFGWDCESQSYKQMGQDLFGQDDFDGFGQSVDLSSDGLTLVVGANQPPPGKSGYVNVYKYDGGEWKPVGHRLDNVKSTIEDVGRQVRISKDGNIVMFSGAVMEVIKGEGEYASSFIRVMENVDGEWKNKGDDLLQSIQYDDYGAEVHIALSGNGQTLGVTGSYSTFTAKMYTFDEKKKNWTETVIPPMKNANDTTQEGWDYDYENYFDGNDISLNDDGTVVAIAGTTYWDEANGAAVRVLNKTKSGNWTLSHDVIDYTQDYMASSVAVSGSGSELAVGINAHGDGLQDQGALFVTMADNSDLGWTSLGKIDGRQRDDLLGSRVTISSDGKIAAASSRKGYIVFFKVV